MMSRYARKLITAPRCKQLIRVRRLLWVVFTVLSACAAPPPSTPLQARHHSSDLQQLMQRLNHLAYDRNQTELELDKVRLKRARDLAATASELAARASELRPERHADDNAHAAFTAAAEDLADAARDLGELAEQRRYDELAEQMRRVRHQCDSCHQRFRGP